MTKRHIILPALILPLILGAALSLAQTDDTKADDDARTTIVIGSKKFTENVILGEIARGLIEHEGYPARHRAELGGTRVLYEALLAGDIDLYPDYTGTILEAILASENFQSMRGAREYLAQRGIALSPTLGFNNTYAIAIRPDLAERLGIETISDLADHPGLTLRFGNEFMDRDDGWPALRRAYALPHSDVKGLDHDLAYRGIAAGEFDVMDAYNTDAEIEYHDLRILEDDAGHFPTYDALFLYRADLQERAPSVVDALANLHDTIDVTRMRTLNERVKIGGESECRVAADFLDEQFGIDMECHTKALASRILRTTREHLILVGVSLALGLIIALPLGILAAKREKTGQGILAAFGILQTIPSLALLALMIPILGIGNVSAIAALTLYALLPLGRGAHAGIKSIPPTIEESAEALGLSPIQRLLRIELPLAGPAIMNGVKTAAVILIGFATLGALIGAGGYGQPILTGIRLSSNALILEGALPAAALAILAQALFEALERLLVPRGLRLKRAT